MRMLRATSWPLFQPLHKNAEDFTTKLERDFGRALANPLGSVEVLEEDLYPHLKALCAIGLLGFSNTIALGSPSGQPRLPSQHTLLLNILPAFPHYSLGFNQL
ncbi:hypothetical protein BDQ17DRAFT_1353023 [Cyathus striatus]|nr:hypothetical protein BDQ17DRAFT_1353023 [Cyathus striatus]